jgi:hypothetical protein
MQRTSYLIPSTVIAALAVVGCSSKTDSAHEPASGSESAARKVNTPKPAAGSVAPKTSAGAAKSGAPGESDSPASTPDARDSGNSARDAQADTADAATSDGATDSEPSGGGAGSAGKAAAAGGGGASSTSLPPSPDRGPYFSSDAWHGFFWTAEHGTGTTLSSSNFTEPMFETPVCIQGSVSATPDSSGNAMLGVNLNQAQAIDAQPQTLVPSHDGILVAVTNSAGSPLRVQVQALDGATNEHARWCATVTGSGGFIPWTEFNTACWDGTGAAYDREPISAAMLLVPGTTDAATPFDFCVVRLTEADAPTAAAGSSG